MFRGNAEAKLRKKILNRGYSKRLIGLPANLFNGTGIPASIIVLDKSEATANRPVQMIGPSRGFVEDDNQNYRCERDFGNIIDAFTCQQTIPGYSRLVPFDMAYFEAHRTVSSLWAKMGNTPISAGVWSGTREAFSIPISRPARTRGVARCESS